MGASRRIRRPFRVGVLRFFALLTLPRVLLAQETGAQIHRERLDNGLEVVVAPAGTAPTATVEVVVRSGAATQALEEEEGLPHVLEHMLFRGYGGGSRRSFASFASDLGAAYNGTTGQEAVTYFLTLPAEEVEGGIELLADLVREPRFTSADLEEERNVVRGELERRASDPFALLDIYTDQMLWGEAFRQRNSIGNVLTIMGADTDLLDDYYARFYVPDNAALVVAGDVDPARVVEVARAHLSGWHRSERPPARPPVLSSPVERDTAFVLEADASDATILVRWVGPGLESDPSAVAAGRLYADMVNLPTSGTQGRLVATGLFDEVVMTVTPDRRAGVVSLTARTSPNRLERASRALRQEVEVLGSGWAVDETGVERARLRRRVRDVHRRQSGTSRAHTLAQRWARGELDDPVEPPTVEAVRGFASTWVAGRPRVTGFLVTRELTGRGSAALVAAVTLWMAS